VHFGAPPSGEIVSFDRIFYSQVTNQFTYTLTLFQGSTGYLGSFILHQLLTESQANVFCLVRESLNSPVEARLKQALTKVGLWNDQVADLIRDRVRTFSADIALMHLGLDVSLYPNIIKYCKML
jgi:thioester reductase-like protein